MKQDKWKNNSKIKSMKQDKWKNNYKIKSMNQDKLIEDNYLNSTKKLQNKSP